MVKRKTRYRSKKRAASSIQQAWRKRRRSRTSLITRTVKANRRGIARINRKIENKYLDNFLIAQPSNNYQGQFMNAFAGVDLDGEDLSGENVGLQPLFGLVSGTQDGQRIGDDITLKRITFRYTVRAGYSTAVPPFIVGPNEQQQYVTFVVVHDNAPDGELAKWPAIFKTSTGVKDLQHPQNVFLNVDNVGRTSRYKVLTSHTVQVQVNQKYYGTIAAGSDNYPENALLAPTQTGTKRGSFHVQAPYGIKYQNSGSTPTNQNIYVICCSNVVKDTHQNGLNLPEICLNARVSYKDA